MTHGKRYQVFISSTYQDLHEERQELIRALLELDCIPAGMELFPAADDDAWTLIKRIIDESDYYLVVSAGRYGSVHPETGISYTEMEFDYAAEQKKPIIAFLHCDIKSLPVNKSEDDPEKTKRLENFRERLRERVVKEWSTPDVLAGVASRSIIQLVKQKPGVGWIRADNAPDSATSIEISKLKGQLAASEGELVKMRTLVDLQDRNSPDGKTLPVSFVPTAEYIEEILGADLVSPILKAVYDFLSNQASRNPYVGLNAASGTIAQEFDISTDTVADILHLLHRENVLHIDSDDDIHTRGVALEVFREWKVAQKLRDARAKNA